MRYSENCTVVTPGSIQLRMRTMADVLEGIHTKRSMVQYKCETMQVASTYKHIEGYREVLILRFGRYHDIGDLNCIRGIALL